MLCPEYSVVLRPIYSGDLPFQITFKRGFRDSNLRRQSGSRQIDRFSPTFLNPFF
jgi:hypothetical protein